GLVAGGSLVVHLRHVGWVARLDGRHEFLLAVAEGRPVHVDLHLPLGRPAFDLLGEDVVAGSDVALEQPHPELGRALGPRHAPQSLDTGGCAAVEESRRAEYLTSGVYNVTDVIGSYLLSG